MIDAFIGFRRIHSPPRFMALARPYGLGEARPLGLTAESEIPPHLLIVENDVDIRLLYADILCGLQAPILEASNPYEVFDLLRTHPVASLSGTYVCPEAGWSI